VSNKASYTPDEWAVLTGLVSDIGLTVIVSDKTNPLQFIQETLEMARAEEEGEASSVELIKAIYDDNTVSVKVRTDTINTDPFDTPDAQQAKTLAEIEQANAILAKADPGEAEAYKKWLITIAQRVAAAAKAGGFLGIGGVQVSDEEKVTLAKLSSALGL
jgi:hypothetical protein